MLYRGARRDRCGAGQRAIELRRLGLLVNGVVTSAIKTAKFSDGTVADMSHGPSTFTWLGNWAPTCTRSPSAAKSTSPMPARQTAPISMFMPPAAGGIINRRWRRVFAREGAPAGLPCLWIHVCGRPEVTERGGHALHGLARATHGRQRERRSRIPREKSRRPWLFAVASGQLDENAYDHNEDRRRGYPPVVIELV
jgi:hypothetical protein